MIRDNIVSPPHREEGVGVVVAQRRAATVVAIAVFLVLAIAILFIRFKSPHPTVHFPDGTVVSVEIADSPEERRVGLSDHIFLDPDRGMLFMLDGLSRPAFWMKDMKFPIDIVWLRDGIVVGIEPSMPVSTDMNPPSVRPNGDINQVLEVNAGFALKHDLKPGQSLDINLP